MCSSRYVKLRELRLKLGLTQQQMAYLLGLSSRNAYALKECGKRGFTVDEALIVSRVFSTTVEELFLPHMVNETITSMIGG